MNPFVNGMYQQVPTFINGMYQQVPRLVNTNQQQPVRMPLVPVQVVSWHIGTEQQNQLMQLAVTQSGNSQLSSQNSAPVSLLPSRATPVQSVTTSASFHNVNPRAVSQSGLHSANIRAVLPTGLHSANIQAVPLTGLQNANLQPPEDSQFVIGSVFSLADTLEGSTQLQTNLPNARNIVSENGQSHNIRIVNVDPRHSSQRENVPLPASQGSQDPQIMIRSVFSLADDVRQRDHQKTHCGSLLLSTRDDISHERKQNQQNITTVGVSYFPSSPSYQDALKNKVAKTQNLAPQRSSVDAVCPSSKSGTTVSSTHLSKSDVLPTSLGTALLHSNNSNFLHVEPPKSDILQTLLKTSPLYVNSSNNVSQLKSPPISTTVSAKFSFTNDASRTLRNCPATSTVPSTKIIAFGDAGNMHKNLTATPVELSQSKILTGAEQKHQNVHQIDNSVSENVAVKDPKVIVVDLDNEDIEDCMLVKIDLSRYKYNYAGKIHNSKVVIDDSDNDENVTDLTNDNGSPSQSAEDCVSAENEKQQNCVKSNSGLKQQPNKVVDNFLINQKQSKVSSAESSITAHQNLNSASQSVQKVNQVISHKQSYEINTAKVQNNPAKQTILEPTLSGDASSSVFEELDMQVEDETEDLSDTECSPGKLLIASELSLSGSSSPVELKTTSSLHTFTYVIPNLQAKNQSSNCEAVTHGIENEPIPNLQTNNQSNNREAVSHGIEKEPIHVEKSQLNKPTAVVHQHSLNFHKATAAQHSASAYNIPGELIKVQNVFNFQVTEAAASHDKTSDEPSTSNEFPPANNSSTAVAVSHSTKDPKQVSIMCKLCFLFFPSRMALATHVLNCHRMVHGGNKYQCQHCRMTFISSSLLKLHQKCKCSSNGQRLTITGVSEFKNILEGRTTSDRTMANQPPNMNSSISVNQLYLTTTNAKTSSVKTVYQSEKEICQNKPSKDVTGTENNNISKQECDKPGQQRVDNGMVHSNPGQSHQLSFSSEKHIVHECGFCYRKFFSHSAFMKHRRSSICCKMSVREFTCSVCKQVFTTATLCYLHMWSNPDCKLGIEKYCSKCTLVFKDSMEKQAHLQLSEKCWFNEVRLLESVIKKSGKSQDYDYLKQLKRARDSSDNIGQLSEKAGTASTNSFHDDKLQTADLSSSKTVRCEMCKIWFSSYAYLKQHFIISAQCKVHNDKLYGQGKTDVKKIQSPPKRRGAMCLECKRRFATNEVLALHLSDSTKCRMKVIKSSKSSKKRSELDKSKLKMVQDDFIQEVDGNANNQSKSASSAPSVSKNGPNSVTDVCQVRESEPQRQLLIHCSENMSCNIIPTINKNLPKKKELRIILKPVSVMCKTCYLPFSNDQYLSKHLQTSTSCLISSARTPQKEDSHSENKSQNSAYFVNTADTQIKSNAKLDFTLVNHDHNDVVESGEVHANRFNANEMNVNDESKEDNGSNVLFVINDSSSSEDDTDSENSTSSCEEVGIEYKCKVCSKTFNSRSVFMKHVKTQCNSSQRNKSVHCKVCTRKFHDRVGLQAHLLKYKFCFIPLTRAMWERKQEPYTCCMCKKSFQSPKILRKHCFKKMTCRLRYVDLLLNGPKIQDSHEESVISPGEAQILQPTGNSSLESKKLTNGGSLSTQGGENCEAEKLSSSTDAIQVSSKSVTSGNTVVETEKECAGCGKKFANFLEHLFKQQSCLEVYGKGRVKCPVQLPYCFNCKTRFENFDIFSNHSCDGSSSCPSCFREFASTKGLKIHIQLVHKLESIQDVSELKDKERKQHVKDFSSTESVNPTEKSTNKQPTDQLFPCKICDAKFPNLRLLMEHSYEHIEDISLTCERCNITFHHYNRFVSHQAYHIRMDKEAIDELEEQQQPYSECSLEERSLPSPSSSSNDKGSSVCMFCHQDFLNKSSKIDHIYKNPACKASMRHTVDRMFLKKDLTENKGFGQTTTQLDRCEFCLRKFSDRISHYLSSSCLESLEEAVVKYRSNLNHIEHKNEGITSEVRETAAAQHSSQSSNRIYCKFYNCNISFGSKSAYHRHIRKHTEPQQSHAKILDSENWYCVKCNRTLKTLPEAKHHSSRCNHNQLLPLSVMEHADWSYLRCKICNITYVKKVGLVKHMRSIHCNVKSKLPQANVSNNVLCTICNECIFQSQTKEHLLQHRPDFYKMASERALLKGSPVKFVCFICDRAFSFGSDLARHITSHSHSHIFVSEPGKVAKDDKSEEESSENREQASEDFEQRTMEESPSELVREVQSKTHTTVHKIGNFHAIGSCRICHKKFSNFVAFRFHFKNAHKKYGSVNYEHYLKPVKEPEVKMDPERTGGSARSVFFKPGRFSEKSPSKTFVTGTYNRQNQDLEQHEDKIQTIHKKIEGVQRVCPICRECFTKISLYQAHLRIHLKKCVVVVNDCSQVQAKPIIHYSPAIRNGQSSLKVKIRVDNDSVHKILYLQEEMIHLDGVVSEDDTLFEAEESDHTTSAVCASESDKLGDESESDVLSQNVYILEQAGDGSIPENTMSLSKMAVPNSETSVECDSTLEIDTDKCISEITCNEGNACTEDTYSGSGNSYMSNKRWDEFAEAVQLDNEESYNGCEESDLQDNTLPEDLKKKDAGEDNQDQYSRETLDNTHLVSELSTLPPDQIIQNTYAECQKRKMNEDYDEEDNLAKKLKVTDETHCS